MSPEQVDSAEVALLRVLGPEVAQLMRPVLRGEHAHVADAIERLPWGAEPIDIVSEKALGILTDATRPGGPVDPKDDDADVVWAIAMKKMAIAPRAGTKMARRWFVHLERWLWDDQTVSPVVMAVAAYAVAQFEDTLAQPHEAWWWMQAAAAQTDCDERAGVGLAVVIRAAGLLTGRVT